MSTRSRAIGTTTHVVIDEEDPALMSVVPKTTGASVLGGTVMVRRVVAVFTVEDAAVVKGDEGSTVVAAARVVAGNGVGIKVVMPGAVVSGVGVVCWGVGTTPSSANRRGVARACRGPEDALAEESESLLLFPPIGPAPPHGEKDRFVNKQRTYRECWAYGVNPSTRPEQTQPAGFEDDGGDDDEAEAEPERQQHK